MDLFKIIPVIAWRNLWRSRSRSLVVIISMALGIWAGIFLSGFSIGLNEQRTETALHTYLGMVQVHAGGWSEEQSVDKFIPSIQDLEQSMESTSEFKAYSERLIQTGMAASSRGALGVMIQGVTPAQDTLVLDLYAKLTSGEYLPESGRVPYALVGEALADELKLELGDRLQLTFQDVNGYATPALFRVGGTFRTASSMYDKSTVIVRREDLTALMSAPANAAHEMVVMLEDKVQARDWAAQLSARFPELEIEAWQEVSPELGYADDMMAYSLLIFIGIILLALAFGLLNTMLMAILERKRELGMLMAVGLNKKRLFVMIVVETVFLGFFGAPIGILMGHFSLLSLQDTGVDLSVVGEGLNSFGMEAIVYPAPVPHYYLIIAGMVVAMTLLASLYPARKALKLNPVEAIRSL